MKYRIGLLTLFVVCGLFIFSALQDSFAEQAWQSVNGSPLRYNSVWGKIDGLDRLKLTTGDTVYVGMFNEEGDCYGLGPYDFSRGTYSLSAYGYEEADSSKPNDFDLPGFRDGDPVTFKIQIKSTGQTFDVGPSGEKYYFKYADKYPTLKIDLVYNGTSTPEDPTDPDTPPSDNDTADGTGDDPVSQMAWGLAPEESKAGDAKGADSSASEEKTSSGGVLVYGEGPLPQSSDRTPQGAAYDSAWAGTWEEIKKPVQKTEDVITTDYNNLFDDMEYSNKPAREGSVDLTGSNKPPHRGMSTIILFLFILLLILLLIVHFSASVCARDVWDFKNKSNLVRFP